MFPGCHIGHPCPGSDGSGTPELWSQTVIPQPSCAPRDWEEKHGAPSCGWPAAVRWPASPGACSPAIGAPTTPAAHFLLAQLCSTATGKPLGAIGLSITNGRSQKNSYPFLDFCYYVTVWFSFSAPSLSLERTGHLEKIEYSCPHRGCALGIHSPVPCSDFRECSGCYGLSADSVISSAAGNKCPIHPEPLIVLCGKEHLRNGVCS